MEEQAFWAVIDKAETADGLMQALSSLDAGELAGFEGLWQNRYDAAKSWEVWGAAYVLNGGCSDDCFDYFRAYLISCGRTIFEAALADPDALADLDVLNEDEAEWEDWMYPTWRVVGARSGEYGPAIKGDRVRKDLTGKEWDEDDLDALYPRLSAKFG